MNKNVKIISEYQDLIRGLYGYAKECLQFDEDAKISFIHSSKNASNPLGKTAFYDPEQKKISIFITGRHIKDVCRSLTHEIVHHAQNCRGDLQGHSTDEGYAQENSHLRRMEEEAYLAGNLIFRDYEDKIKKENNNERY